MINLRGRKLIITLLVKLGDKIFIKRLLGEGILVGSNYTSVSIYKGSTALLFNRGSSRAIYYRYKRIRYNRIKIGDVAVNAANIEEIRLKLFDITNLQREIFKY
jgi:hypothetical protein